eukprot:1970952-Amphidinium_carterae.1
MRKGRSARDNDCSSDIAQVLRDGTNDRSRAERSFDCALPSLLGRLHCCSSHDTVGTRAQFKLGPFFHSQTEMPTLLGVLGYERLSSGCSAADIVQKFEGWWCYPRGKTSSCCASYASKM